LRIVCEDHDEVIAKVVDTDDGVAYSTPLPASAMSGTHGKGLTLHKLRLFRTVFFDD